MDISINKLHELKSAANIIFLWGMMGAGKTKIGKRLANKLGWEFVDTDNLIEQTYHRSVSEIFIESGESCFRDYEKKILQDIVKLNHVVVATGGGMPVQPDLGRIMLENGLCIWLDAELEILASRLHQSIESRPLLSGAKSREELVDQLSLLLDQRIPFYAKANWKVSAKSIDVKALSQVIKEFNGG